MKNNFHFTNDFGKCRTDFETILAKKSLQNFYKTVMKPYSHLFQNSLNPNGVAKTVWKLIKKLKIFFCKNLKILKNNSTKLFWRKFLNGFKSFLAKKENVLLTFWQKCLNGFETNWVKVRIDSKPKRIFQKKNKIFFCKNLEILEKISSIFENIFGKSAKKV